MEETAKYMYNIDRQVFDEISKDKDRAKALLINALISEKTYQEICTKLLERLIEIVKAQS